MGKRTTRIYSHQLPQALVSQQGKDVHIILWNGHTYFGKLISNTDADLCVEDKGTFWYNRKRHTHTLPISEIREVISERQSEE